MPPWQSREALLGERGPAPESIETTCDYATLTKSVLMTKLTVRGAFLQS